MIFDEKNINCTAIVCMGLDHSIGKGGKMPWHLPEDLRYFKEKTAHLPLIMGRKTFESIGRVLPDRPHIVVTRQSQQEFQKWSQSFPNPSNQKVWTVSSFAELHDLKNSEIFKTSLTTQQLDSLTEKNSFGFFVIGGAEIYRLAIKENALNKILVTEIQSSFFDADTHFPKFDRGDWKQISASEMLTSKTGLQFCFKEFEKLKLP